jgi:hypothetical protein
MTEWVLFSQSLICNFGPDRNTTGDLAPPRHVITVNDYINNFIAYALHAALPVNNTKSASSSPAFRMHSEWQS